VNDTKRKIREACKAKNIPLCRMLAAANIQTGDYYQAVNGKKPFFPNWRKRISKVLNTPGAELFPEFSDK
jgi:hypothetical protein